MGATCCKDAPQSVEIHHIDPDVQTPPPGGPEHAAPGVLAPPPPTEGAPQTAAPDSQTIRLMPTAGAPDAETLPPPPLGEPEAPPEEVIVLASPSPTPEALAERLLERLLANAPEEVALPIRPHSERLRSGARGFSVAFLRGFLHFLRRRGAHELQMAELCKQPGLAVSVCRLTASTGLSLVESCVLLAEAEGLDVSALFGVATSFFSYSWTGTQVDDMAAAAERGVAQLEEASTGPRCLWLDMLCASQNLLAVRGARSHPRSILSLPTISYSPPTHSPRRASTRTSGLPRARPSTRRARRTPTRSSTTR